MNAQTPMDMGLAWGVNQGAVIAVLSMLVLLLSGLVWHHARKIRRLEQQLISQHRFMRQELKMMSQGAIGVGNRVKHLEKQVRQQPTPFEQLLMQQAEPTKPAPSTPSRAPEPSPARPKSRAEQALTDWMRDSRTTA